MSRLEIAAYDAAKREHVNAEAAMCAAQQAVSRAHDELVAAEAKLHEAAFAERERWFARYDLAHFTGLRLSTRAENIIRRLIREDDPTGWIDPVKAGAKTIADIQGELRRFGIEWPHHG